MLCALRGLQGFERVSDVEGKLAAIESRAPWDGSDGEEVVEEVCP